LVDFGLIELKLDHNMYHYTYWNHYDDICVHSDDVVHGLIYQIFIFQFCL